MSQATMSLRELERDIRTLDDLEPFEPESLLAMEVHELENAIADTMLFYNRIKPLYRRLRKLLANRLDLDAYRIVAGCQMVYVAWVCKAAQSLFDTLKLRQDIELIEGGTELIATMEDVLEELEKPWKTPDGFYFLREDLKGLEKATDSVVRIRGVRRNFASLSKEWVEGTAHLSSKSRIKSHPAYLRLLDLGPDIVPLIVAQLRTEPAYWFYLLSDLTGENPVPPGSSGNVPAMVEAWTRWYEAKSSAL